MTTLERQTYSTQEAALMAGVSYRQLDHWLRVGTINPCLDANPGSGRPRRFSAEDVDVLCEVVANWRNAQAVVEDFRSGQLWTEVSQNR